MGVSQVNLDHPSYHFLSSFQGSIFQRIVLDVGFIDIIEGVFSESGKLPANNRNNVTATITLVLCEKTLIGTLQCPLLKQLQ